MHFGPQRFARVYLQPPVADSVFRPALLRCIDRYTVTGVAVLIGSSPIVVQLWRQGRRKAKHMPRRAVMLLDACPTEEVENLARVLTQIPPETVVDQPVKALKRTLPVVVSCDYEI